MKSVKSLFRGVVVIAALMSAPFSAVLAAPTFTFTSQAGQQHPIGSTFSIDVLATGFTDLYAYQFSVNFNPAIVHVLGVTEGGFLSAGGSTFFDGGTVDNANGTVSFVFDTLISAVPGVSGSGVLAHLDLQALQVGTSVFSLTDVLALDSLLNDITVTATPIALVVPEPGTISLMFLAAGAGMFLRRRRQSGRVGDRQRLSAS
jgi:hypothetical protein